MRTRQIKPSFYTSDDTGDLDFHIRDLFIGLWLMADRRGRLKYQPNIIRATLYPHKLDSISDADIVKWLDILHKRHLITIYSVAKQRLIQVNAFERHQHCHHKEAESILPKKPQRIRRQRKIAPDKSEAGAPDKTGTGPSSSTSTSTSTSTSSSSSRRNDAEDLYKNLKEKEILKKKRIDELKDLLKTAEKNHETARAKFIADIICEKMKVGT